MFTPVDAKDPVELAAQAHKDACEQRLAKRLNNADPEHKNGCACQARKENKVKN